MIGLGMLIQGMVSGQDRREVPVVADDHLLEMAWAGGFNAPQFSNIDLNRDGIRDLIAFDRQGDQIRTYLRMPASGLWRLDWTYTAQFPPVTDWLLVRDYDGDGVEDLFTGSSSIGIPGVTIFKGQFDNGTWSFVQQKDRGQSYLQVPAGPALSNLYVSWDDIPAVDDIDGDGDLDILAFEPGGTFIAYYRNQSVESGWGRDSLRFLLEDNCWGKILENELSEQVYLSDDPDKCSDGNFTGDEIIVPRHAGSTVMSIDLDFDGDKDAFVGDISSRRLVKLINGLNAEQAWITEQESHFPATDVSVDLPYFVASFAVELDDDPEPEFLAAVNSRSLTEDRASVWRYDDDPLSDGPLDFKLTEKGFFQREMIDLGSHARPAAADVNGDGLQDLVVGGYYFTDGAQTRIPALWLFLGTGAPSAPAFRLADRDWLGMSQYATLPTFDFAPAFGDLDGNGSVDLVVGDQNGRLFFLRNQSASGLPMAFDAAIYPYMNIAVGVSATPQVVDINGDGLGDLVVGERTGNADNGGRCSNLNYFQNIGSIGSAMFGGDPTVAPNTQCFGRLLFDIQPGLPQYSTPSIFRTPDGLMLLTGMDDGTLALYAGVESGISTPLSLVEGHFDSIDVGNRSAPLMADLDADGVFELVAGNQRGGLELFGTSLIVGTTSLDMPAAEWPVALCTIDPQGVYELRTADVPIRLAGVYDVLGRLVRHPGSAASTSIGINLLDQPAGYYVIIVRDESGRTRALPAVKG